MIYRLIDLPENIIGFKASWKVTERDCEEVLLPLVENHVEKTGDLNCLLVLKHFKTSAFKSLKRLLKCRIKWRRVAVVAESGVTKNMINFMSMFFPGEIKGFSKNEMDQAIYWASETSN